MKPVLSALVLGAGLLTAASSAQAQVFMGPNDAPRRGSWEVGGGVVWTGGFDLDSVPPQLTGNGGDNATPITLFDVESRVGAISGVQGRVGFYFTPIVSVEGGVQFSRPIVSARISGDFEDAEPVTAEEKMSRYIFDGSILLHMRGLLFAGGRGVPFVAFGAGYLRELHESNELVETGTTYHGGLGIKVWLNQGPRRLGLRGDVGFSIRDGAFEGESGRRTLPTAGASLVYLF